MTRRKYQGFHLSHNLTDVAGSDASFLQSLQGKQLFRSSWQLSSGEDHCPKSTFTQPSDKLEIV
jgi:hypothetical protein